MKKVTEFRGTKPGPISDSVLSTFTATFDIDKLPSVDLVEEYTVVGKIASSDLYRLYTKLTANGAEGAGANTVSFNEDVCPFVVGEAVTVGTNDGGAITSIDHENKTIAFTNSITWGDGDVIKLTSDDGSATAVGLVRQPLTLNDEFGDEDIQAAVMDVCVIHIDVCNLVDDAAKTALKGITFRG